MGSVLTNIIFAIHIIVCLGVILLVLLHSGKGGGISGLFSGMVETFDGSGMVEKNLDRMTVILGIAFAVTTVVLFILL